MNLNQITLPTRDIAKSRQFYIKMGFELIVDADHYLRFASKEGSATFSVIKVDEDFKNGSIIYFETPELDSLVLELKSKGFTFDQDPKDMDYLWREAILHDPAGNMIKLYWAGDNRVNPPWRVSVSA